MSNRILWRRAAALLCLLCLPACGAMKQEVRKRTGVDVPTGSASGPEKPDHKYYTVEVPSIPKTVDEYVALRDSLATTPAGGAVMMAVALIVYSSDVPTGLQCLTVALDQHWLNDGKEGYKGKQPRGIYIQQWRERIGRFPHIPRSYVQGTTPQNGYALPPGGPYVFNIKEQVGDVELSTARIFIECTGADHPRPVRVKKNNRGIWKADEWSSLEVGIRAPVDPKKADDDL